MGEVIGYSIFAIAGGIITLALIVQIPPVKRWWRRKVEK